MERDRNRDRIYAKSADENGDKEPLAEHTIHDIEIGRYLIQNLPFGIVKKRRIAKDLDLALAFHDVGKAATGFQESLDTRVPWGKRHEVLSAAAAAQLGLDTSVIFAVITHHKQILSDGVTVKGCLLDEQLPYTDHNYEAWQQMATQYNDNVVLMYAELELIFSYIKREDLLTTSLDLDPLTTQLSDDIMNWLHRNRQRKIYRHYKKREYVSLLRGLVMSADHIASTGSDYVPAAIPNLTDYPVTDYQLYGFQERAHSTIGNLILKAPTGSGKTEAALLWAKKNQQHNGRLFYALPTTASINAMYTRLQKTFKDTENKKLVGLLHSRATSALYSLFENGIGEALARQQTAWDIASLVREMYFPIRVCTPHQILRYSLQGKGWEAMLSEFPHSVFIFDEIHAYNPKLTGLTLATAKYLVQHKARVIFLTATLPTFLRNYVEKEIPGIQFIEPSYYDEIDRKILEQKRHIVEPLEGNIIDNLEIIIAKSQAAISTLVVCNHVPTVQAVYKTLKEDVSDTVLLHSRFNRRDRNNMEGDLLRSKLPKNDPNYKPLPKVLVATQVVEVSLDLDFEQGFTEPAAIDAIVQRMGRINRYGSQPKAAHVYIFTQQYSDDNHVYTEEIRNSSLAVITSLTMPLSEKELNEVADTVYGNGYQGKDLILYNEGLNYDKLKQFKRYLTAGTSQNWIEEVIEDQEGTTELLPEQLLTQYRNLRADRLFIEANDLLVPVSRRRLPELFEKGMIVIDEDFERLLIVTDCNYSSEVRLELDGGEHTT